jgi:hypothetical protein
MGSMQRDTIFNTKERTASEEEYDVSYVGCG